VRVMKLWSKKKLGGVHRGVGKNQAPTEMDGRNERKLGRRPVVCCRKSKQWGGKGEQKTCFQMFLRRQTRRVNKKAEKNTGRGGGYSEPSSENSSWGGSESGSVEAFRGLVCPMEGS